MFEIKFDKNKNQSIAYDNNIKIGECNYIETEDGWNIIHTEVNNSYQGQGIARRLVQNIIENAKKYNKKIVAECSYAKKVIENKKVIIGIVSKHYNTDKKRTDSYVRDEVKQAIFDNGAIAIGILSPNEEILYCRNNWQDFAEKLLKEDIISQLNLCDGIIIQGGTTNEVFESFIAKYCFENDIPVLGICAGQNCIADAIDGSIKYIDNPEKHNQADEDYVHSIKIDNTSKFYKIVNKEVMMVNSRHRNTIDNASVLDKVAFCEDGYADVIESKDKTFYIGLRFHPESLYKIDESMNNIFKKFIEIIKKK